MSENEYAEVRFSAWGMGSRVPFGGLADPTEISVTLSGPAFGAEDGWAALRQAADAHGQALESYVRLLHEAGGDVTEARVRQAARVLHESISMLPVAHTMYAGVGFPAAADGPGETPRPEEVEARPPWQGPRSGGIHPHLFIALVGTLGERYALADVTNLPTAIELVLARDPDALVRTSFLLADSNRGRAAMLLMEREETDADIRRELAQQRQASPDLKLDLRLGDLGSVSRDGLVELLGLSDEERSSLEAIWNEALLGPRRRAARMTVREAISRVRSQEH